MSILRPIPLLTLVALTPLIRPAAAAPAQFVELDTSFAYPAGEKLTLDVQTAGYPEVRVSILRLTPSGALRRWSTREGGTFVRGWTATQPPAEAQARHLFSLEVPPLDPGFYVLIGQAGTPDGTPAQTERAFTVSSVGAQGFIASGSPGSMFVFDVATGAPHAGAAVTGAIGPNRNPVAWTGTTDAMGRVALPPIDLTPHANSGAAAMAGGQPIRFNLPSHPNLPRLTADVLLDQPRHAPGERVRWKLVLRELRDGALRSPAGAYRMTVRLGDRTLLDNQLLRPNSFGAIDGEIFLPRDVDPGWAKAEATLTPEQGGAAMSFPFFDVVGPQPPPAPVGKVAITLTGPIDSLRPGGEITAQVEARDASGAPAARATVESSLWTQQSEMAKEMSSFEQYGAKTTVVTDAAGRAELRAKIPPSLPPRNPGTRAASPDLFEVMLQAKVTADTGAIGDEHRIFKISPTAALVDPGAARAARLARPGDRVTFSATILDANGQPRALRDVARLVEERWSEVWTDPDGRTLSGAAVAAARREVFGAPYEIPAPWKVVERRTVETPVAEAPFAAGADGKVSVAFTLPHAGYYRVHFGDSPFLPFDSEPDDTLREYWDRKANSNDAFAVVAADETTSTLAIPSYQPAVYGPRSLAPGEPLRLFVVLAEGEHSGILSIQGEDTDLSQRVEFRDRARLVVVDHPPAALNRLEVFVTGLPPGAPNTFAFDSIAVEIDHARQRLDLRLTPVLTSPRAGTESAIRVSVHDAAGRPVRAEVALIGGDAHEPAEAATRRTSGATDPGFWRRILEQRSRLSRMDYHVPEQPSAPSPRIEAMRRHSFVIAEAPEAAFARPSDVTHRLLNGNGVPGDRSDPLPPEAEGTWVDPADSVSPVNAEREVFGGAVHVFNSQPFLDPLILWQPSVTTDANGEAVIPVRYPNSATNWTFEAYATTSDPQSFGRAHLSLHTVPP